MKTTSAKPTDNFFVSPFDRPHPISWTNEFDHKAPLNIEIGFGNGEYLVRQAQKMPNENFIGLEIEGELIEKALRRIRQNKIKNIRLLKLDAQIAFERLFDQRSIHHIDCLFPFPWPKKRHYRHRLFQNSFLKLMNSRLEAKGGLTVVTDYEPYYDWTIAQSRNTGFRIVKKEIPAQFDTKFERKWASEGQKLFFELNFQKIQHVSCPVTKEETIAPMPLNAFDPHYFSPQNKTGKTSIIFKKFIYDSATQKSTQHVLVAEAPLIQRFIVTIEPCANAWSITLNEHQKIFKTKGIKESLVRIKKACRS